MRMGKFTVTRTLTAPREQVWRILTLAPYFERWLPAKEGTAVLDVRTGGSWQASVVSEGGEEIALVGRYDDVSEPERLVMTIPGDAVAEITLAAMGDTTEIAYTFDVPEDMHGLVEESVDKVLGKVSQVLAETG
jgi:uncharacterized protein YndB with AHSA1/START domain